MTRYIARRLLQAIPLLFIISLILFVLMRNTGDPLATLGGRHLARAEDRARLARQLGLDKPLLVQYVYWLIGNDWTKWTWMAMASPKRPAPAAACCEASSARHWCNRGKPGTEVIWERLPNTLLLMLTSRGADHGALPAIGIYSALAPVFLARPPDHRTVFRRLLDADLLRRAAPRCTCLRSSSSAGACLTCLPWGCSTRKWARRWAR
jgi:hypothetical protein